MDFKVKEHTPVSGDSLDNPHRVELLWETREEDLLNRWIKESRENSKHHRKQGLKHKFKYAVFSIAGMLTPIILSGVGSALDDIPLVRSLLLILSGSVVGISTFFNFGEKMANSLEYEALYNEFSNELEMELSKPKANRVQCDVFLQKYLDRFNQLNNNAPL